jgi:hypothetical protein
MQPTTFGQQVIAAIRAAGHPESRNHTAHQPKKMPPR